MSQLRSCVAILGCVLAVVAATGATAVGERTARGHLVIPHGQPVQIVVAVDDTGFGAFFGPSSRAAVQMAVDRQRFIRGFPIRLNAFNAPCGGGTPASLAANASVATAVVSNAQNVAVVGHPCSAEAPAWLPIYATAGLVTINGSVTEPNVPSFGPTVFNDTAVADPAFTASWYPAVKALPSDVRWRARFEARFGSPPTDFADLYYDAANVLLAAIRETARIDRGDLVIDRAALAAAVRRTRGFRGVTCIITLDRASGYRVDDPAALARCAHDGDRHAD